jgi:hypothetical protein
MLAEVSDKIPTLATIWVAGLIAAAVVYTLCRLHCSVAFILFPICLWLMWEIRYEFFTDIRSAIIGGQGVGYLVQLGISTGLSSLVALFFIARAVVLRIRSRAIFQIA